MACAPRIRLASANACTRARVSYRKKKLAAQHVDYSFVKVHSLPRRLPKQYMAAANQQPKGTLEDGEKRVILVTGGLGLVGREVVRLLLEDGTVAVRCFDVVPPNSADARVTHVRGRLEDFDHCERACEGVDSVIHCAALLGPLGVTEQDLMRVNVHGTQTLMLACYVRQVKRLVVTSSVAAVLDRQKGQLMQCGDEMHVKYPARKEDFIEPCALIARAAWVLTAPLVCAQTATPSFSCGFFFQWPR